VLALVVGLWALGQPSLAWDQAPRLGWRLGLIAAYPPLVLATGIYTRGELRITWNAVKGYFGGGEHEREHAPPQP
jgi:hypothetical protein